MLYKLLVLCIYNLDNMLVQSLLMLAKATPSSFSHSIIATIPTLSPAPSEMPKIYFLYQLKPT